MWALVKEGVIEKIYYSPKSIVLDNVRYLLCTLKMKRKELISMM